MKSAAPMSASSARSSTCTNDFQRSASNARPSRRHRASAADAWPAAAEARPTLTKPSTGAATGVTLETRHRNAVPCDIGSAAAASAMHAGGGLRYAARARAPAPKPAWRCRPRLRQQRVTQKGRRALPGAARKPPCLPTTPARGASRQRRAPANQARASRRRRRSAATAASAVKFKSWRRGRGACGRGGARRWRVTRAAAACA